MFLSRTSGPRAIVAASIVTMMTTLACRAEVAASPSKAPLVADATPQTSRPVRLDVSDATVRDAARASAQAMNDGVVDRDPAAQSKAFKELLPSCNGLVAAAEFAVLAAACLTNHCGESGSVLDRTSPMRPVPLPRPSAMACTSRGIKLW